MYNFGIINIVNRGGRIVKLNEQDKELIQLATKVASANADIYPKPSMTVGCVLKAKSGKVYKGVNIYTSHSICAEQVAFGQALANGEREFDTIVAVKMNDDNTSNVITPCGVCRYLFDKFGVDINVIVNDPKNNKTLKVKAEELLPYAFKRDVKYINKTKK